MNTKITTLQQVAQLRAGDRISRFPTNGAPQDTFDSSRTNDISAFAIQKINSDTGILSLTTAFEAGRLMVKAGEMGRLFIKPSDLVGEHIWWLVPADKATTV